MRTGRPDRLWLIGGAVGAVALLAVGWFLFVSPRNVQTRSLHDQTATAELQASTLRHRLADLVKQNGELPRYRAERQRDRQALPTDSGLADFLRQLEVAGDSRGVAVSGVLVGSPTPVVVPGGQAYALPITVTATGGFGKLNDFLDQLQLRQPRAVLVNTANAVATEQKGSLAGTVTVTLNLQVFVAPASAGKAQPAKTS
jgi:Tfp pilus assembly protein PilO